MVKIFDINEGNVVINTNCLLIPELKAIVDNYENPIPVLGYVHFMTDPRSPYMNLPIEEREELILKDYDGDYSPDDEPVFKAVEKIKKLAETHSMRLKRRAEAASDNLGKYLEKAQITDGRDTNLPGLLNALKSIRKINQELRGFTQDVEEELRVRGQGNLGYDEL